MKTKLIILALASLALAGCTTTEYQNKEVKFTRKSFLNRTNISELSANPNTGEISIKGYSNEQTEIAAAVAGAVAEKLAPRPQQ